MRPTVLLFDVDGTLITTGGVGRRAIVRALEQRGATGGADFAFAGMTDRAIVRRGLVAAKLSSSETDIDELIEEYLEILADEVDEADEATYRIHGGMLEAIDAAADQAHVALGLGTGNVERGARIKLARVGISHRFSYGGFGCDAEARPELIRIGAERGAAKLGAKRAECRVVVIGDTPKDVAAAKAIDAESFAVATGVVDRATLAAASPTHLYDSLSHPGALRALMQTADGSS